MHARSIATTLALAGAIALTTGGCTGLGQSASGTTTVRVAAPATSGTGDAGDAATVPAATAGGAAADTSSTGTPQAHATTEGRTPSASRSASAPTSTITVTPTPGPTGSPTASPAPTGERHAILGEPGGTLLVDGTRYGRGERTTKEFLALLGTPAATAQRSCEIAGRQVPARQYRWGDLRVNVVEGDVPGEYGFSWPKGQISGWSIDPAPAGVPPLPGTLVGPESTTYGTSLKTLQQRFTTKQWDHAGLEGNSFTIFAGDTTDASFVLGENREVIRMNAGIMC